MNLRWLVLTVMLTLTGCAGVNQHSGSAQDGTIPTSPRQTAKHAADTDASPDAASQHCMALVMYWEARGEGHLGMVAVGEVVMNRVRSDAFPDTPCDVVYQGGETPPCQFSWWCDGKSDRPRNQQQWLVAVSTATDVLADRTADPTGGALFFHSSAIRRPWQRLETARIGGHVFYR